MGGQKMKTEPYRFSLKTSTKVSDKNVENVPAVGEVVQERFNPRPYFAYNQIPSKLDTATYASSKQVVTVGSDAMPSTKNDFDLFPAVFNVAPSTTVQPVDLYTSPYSSYNPPPQNLDNTPISDNYPPTNQDYPGPAPMNVDSEVSKNPYVSLGPPLAYWTQSDDVTRNYGNYEVDAPPSDHMLGHDESRPSVHPHNQDIYYPPHDDNEDNDHPPKNYKPLNMDGTSDMNVDSDLNIGSDIAMSLAPSSDYKSVFPTYLYDNHNYNNYVYKEIPHTTTEGTEDKRVSSGHYSYYYLGRKLWYIPLYFSIYFIIYVTILILKAIARHKIQYKHKWVSSARKSRTVDSNSYEKLDELHNNVNKSIHKASKIYTVFAM